MKLNKIAARKKLTTKKYNGSQLKNISPQPPQQIISQNDAENQTEVKVKKPKTRPTSNKEGGPTALQEEEPKSRRKEVVVIAGDSIVKGQKGWLMSEPRMSDARPSPEQHAATLSITSILLLPRSQTTPFCTVAQTT